MILQISKILEIQNPDCLSLWSLLFQIKFRQKKSVPIAAKRGGLRDLKEAMPFAATKGKDQSSPT